MEEEKKEMHSRKVREPPEEIEEDDEGSDDDIDIDQLIPDSISSSEDEDAGQDQDYLTTSKKSRNDRLQA